jgi:ATP-binding cassette subfamily C protein CydCD
MTSDQPPGLRRPERRRVIRAVGIAAAGEVAAVGLLATGGWLLLSSALRPPVLLLSVAIGAVQIFAFLRGTARYAERLASHNVGLTAQARLRSWLYYRLAQLVPALPGADRGDLLARLISDTEDVQDLVVRAAVPMLAAGTAWAVTVITAGLLLPSAGWILLVAGFLGSAGVAAATMRASRKAAALPAARGAVAAWILGALTGGEELAALGASEWIASQLTERERRLGRCTRAAAGAAGLGRAITAVAGGVGLAGVTWAGAAALRSGRISAVELGILAFLGLGAGALLQRVPDAASRLPTGRAGLRRLAGLGRAPTWAVREQPTAGATSPAVPAPRSAASQHGLHAAQAVALRSAVLAYPRDDGTLATVIKGLDLTLRDGRPVALAGPSGSGKTLVIYALLRFIELTAGQLTVAGEDAATLSGERIRSMFAWIPERPVLFPASLRANLRVGAPQASDSEIKDVLARLRLSRWLGQLDHGLDTVLAPWGQPVSAGERQRLGVARALLSDRPVILADEATGHLDRSTADAVLQAVLEHVGSRRSLLWVTHHPAELATFGEVCDLGATSRLSA